MRLKSTASNSLTEDAARAGVLDSANAGTIAWGSGDLTVSPRGCEAGYSTIPLVCWTSQYLPTVSGHGR
jgi:hypothetical protein